MTVGHGPTTMSFGVATHPVPEHVYPAEDQRNVETELQGYRGHSQVFKDRGKLRVTLTQHLCVRLLAFFLLVFLCLTGVAAVTSTHPSPALAPPTTSTPFSPIVCCFCLTHCGQPPGQGVPTSC